MTSINSEKKQVSKSQEDIFNFLINLNNWEQIMPDRVINWSSNENTCNFTIEGTATLGMKLEKTKPFEEITLSEHGKTPFPFTIQVIIKEISADRSEVEMVFNANLNPMLKLMAINPLRNFLNMLLDNLSKV